MDDKRIIVGIVKSKTITGIVSNGEVLLLQKELEKYDGQRVKVTIEPFK